MHDTLCWTATRVALTSLDVLLLCGGGAAVAEVEAQAARQRATEGFPWKASTALAAMACAKGRAAGEEINQRRNEQVLGLSKRALGIASPFAGLNRA